MKPVPFFGLGVSGHTPLITKQRRLNCYYEVRPDQDKHATIARGTPGAFGAFTLPSNPIRGWWVINNLLYVVAGAKLYSVTTLGVITSLGTLSTSSGIVEISDNGVQLIIVDGVSGYCYTIVTGSYFQAALNAAGSFGAITDANFPNGARTAAFLNGRIYVERRPNSRQFYASNSYDLTGWTNSLSLPTFGTKDNYSDNIQAVDVLNGTLVMWGGATTEYFQDIGTSPLPVARINGTTQLWGLAALSSRAFINNTIIFLGQAQQGGIQVLMLNGYVPVRISTPDIEDIIDDFSTWQDAIALTYNVSGHLMYQLTFPTAMRSFLYDATTGFWSETQTGLGLTGRHFANLGVAFNTLNYVSDSTTGIIYQLDDEVYTDNGTAIKRQLVTRHLHTDGNEYGIDELFLDMETGVGLQSGQGSNPLISLEVSRDNGRTFGIEKWREFGPVGQYLARAIWRRLGKARDFVFRFTVTDPVKFVVVFGAIVMDQHETTDG
jgi:hypothetical protein